MSQQNQKVTMSYVTGSHAFKLGMFTLQGVQEIKERYLMRHHVAAAIRCSGTTPVQDRHAARILN